LTFTFRKKINPVEREIKSVLVLGGTGRTGKHIVQQALEQGLLVTALVRNAANLLEFDNHPNLEILKGDVTNFVDVYNAVQGNNAILSAVGSNGRDLGPITKGTENIIAAIQKSSVSRFICLSSFGAGSTRFKASRLFHLVAGIAGSRPSINAKTQQELLLYKAKIDFTLVMAGSLVDKSKTCNMVAYSATNVPCVRGMPKKITHAEVARFMIAQLYTHQWSRNTVCLLGER
jgi:putative NADH-flavin reductase